VSGRVESATRRSCGRVAAALLLAALAGCDRGPPAPRAKLAESSHEFGALWVGEVVRHSFEVKNAGDRPLEFGDVRSTCGCLLHELTTRRVEPGATASIVAELHADKGPGRLVKSLRVGTNDPKLPWIDLTLAADLTTLYELDPLMVDVQDLVLGEPRDLVVELVGRDGTPLVLGTPTCTEKGFSVSTRAATKERCEVVVRFEGEAFPGRRLFHASLPTGHPRVPEATIPIQAVVQTRLLVEPSDRADFGDVARARGGQLEFRVRRRGATPLAADPVAVVELNSTRGRPPVPGVAAQDPDVRARLEPVEPGREWKLVVEVAPGSPGSSLIGRVSVKLDAPFEPPHTLTLTGRIVD
jgi:hypothetical protein